MRRKLIDIKSVFETSLWSLTERRKREPYRKIVLIPKVRVFRKFRFSGNFAVIFRSVHSRNFECIGNFGKQARQSFFISPFFLLLYYGVLLPLAVSSLGRRICSSVNWMEEAEFVVDDDNDENDNDIEDGDDDSDDRYEEAVKQEILSLPLICCCSWWLDDHAKSTGTRSRQERNYQFRTICNVVCCRKWLLGDRAIARWARCSQRQGWP